MWQRVVQANRPGPPGGLDLLPGRPRPAAVIVADRRLLGRRRVSPAVTLFAVTATVVGNIVSYRRRADPWPVVKPVLAVCAIGGFVWFIVTVTHNATPGDISTVESPLAVLFAWVLSHPRVRRTVPPDVTYTLAGSTALIAVAAAQSVDLALGAWVLAWVGCGVWGSSPCGSRVRDGGRPVAVTVRGRRTGGRGRRRIRRRVARHQRSTSLAHFPSSSPNPTGRHPPT